MPREVLINAGAGEVRVAVIEDGVLDQLWLERTIGFEEVPATIAAAVATPPALAARRKLRRLSLVLV